MLAEAFRSVLNISCHITLERNACNRTTATSFSSLGYDSASRYIYQNGWLGSADSAELITMSTMPKTGASPAT